MPMTARFASLGALLAAAMAAYLHQIGAILPTPLSPKDAAIARLDAKFAAALDATMGLAVGSKGYFYRDRDMLFWWRFADNFGANPATPYMFNALPLLGFLLPSPIWSLGADDAVVLLARVPPACEYFSFTTYAMFRPHFPPLPFASLGDSVNQANIKQHDGLFAHVVTANQKTYELVEQALAASGLPPSAINLAAVPATLGLQDDVVHLGGQVRLGTYFEVLMRLFRFHNQTEGDAYLHSHPPVYYLKGTHGLADQLAASKAPGYRSRAHAGSVDEAPLESAFAAHGLAALERVEAALAPEAGLTNVETLAFAPLRIQGLKCLEQRTKCLGDGPDAAYFAPNVHEARDEMELLTLRTDDELHVVTLCHHRQLGAAVYGSVAMVKPSWPTARTLSKSFMRVRGTSVGVTSFDFGNTSTPFVSWAFTRNAAHCEQLLRASSTADGGTAGAVVAGGPGGGHTTRAAVDGCSVVDEEQVGRDGFLTYCERVYFNPATGLGPDYETLLPARVYHVRVARAASDVL